MKPYTRAQRISNSIRVAITDLLARKMQDPSMEMATISAVKLSSDLRMAEVYVTVFGNKRRIRETLDGFKRSRGFIKKSIAPELGLKFMPELKFIHDDTFDKAARMDELIRSAIHGPLPTEADSEPEDSEPEDSEDSDSEESGPEDSEPKE